MTKGKITHTQTKTKRPNLYNQSVKCCRTFKEIPRQKGKMLTHVASWCVLRDNKKSRLDVRASGKTQFCQESRSNGSWSMSAGRRWEELISSLLNLLKMKTIDPALQRWYRKALLMMWDRRIKKNSTSNMDPQLWSESHSLSFVLKGCLFPHGTGMR